MGLFDALPAPTKHDAISGKRDADSAAAPSASKKPRHDGDQPSNGSGALESAPSGSGGAAGGTNGGSAWMGSLQAAYSEDKGSRLTMEGEGWGRAPAACRAAFHSGGGPCSQVLKPSLTPPHMPALPSLFVPVPRQTWL